MKLHINMHLTAVGIKKNLINKKKRNVFCQDSITRPFLLQSVPLPTGYGGYCLFDSFLSHKKEIRI